MIEAVGAEHRPAYFPVLGRVLAPGGRAGLQAITVPHDRMIAGKATCSRIHEYIFPGGFIGVGPLDRGAGARPHPAADRRDAVVLPRLRGDPRRWRERFLTRWDEVRQLGFDDTFRRMRELCLACSEARFRVGHLGVRQFATAERLGH